MTADLRPIEGAPVEGRRLLGILLAQRRIELGYTRRPAFCRDRLPLTPSGNPNTRLVADLEEAYRDNFPESRLRQLAAAYLVTYESLAGVAHQRAAALVPLPAAISDQVAQLPPMTDAARIAAGRPYADRINRRLRELAARGITDPSGVQLFGPGADARTWDGIGARMAVEDRVWLIADLQRWEERNGGGSSSPEVTSR